MEQPPDQDELRRHAREAIAEILDAFQRLTPEERAAHWRVWARFQDKMDSGWFVVSDARPIPYDLIIAAPRPATPPARPRRRRTRKLDTDS